MIAPFIVFDFQVFANGAHSGRDQVFPAATANDGRREKDERLETNNVRLGIRRDSERNARFD